MEAGCDDVGIGALFGLYDWRFEVLGLVSHAVLPAGALRRAARTRSASRACSPACGVQLDEHVLRRATTTSSA